MTTPDYGDHDPDAACTVCSPVDYKAMYEAERDKFQAETRVTWFLAERLRTTLGAWARCDRCHGRRGSVVARSEDGHRVEWVCTPCTDGTRTEAPTQVGGALLRLPDNSTTEEGR